MARAWEETQSYRFTVGETSLLAAVIDAVAFVEDVDPLALEPLSETIDPEALEALVSSSDSVAASFEVGDVRVTVHGSGEIDVTAPDPGGTIHAELEGVSHVLLLGEAGRELCHEHLSGFPPERTDLISIQTARSADAVLREWASSPPAKGAVLEVGGTARSTAARTAGAGNVAVEPVADLGSIGVQVSELLADWAGDPNRPAVCLDSLEDLVAAVGVKRVFLFLQPVLSRVRKAGGVAHVHLDPAAVDDLDRYTLGTLFDAVVEVDGEGELTVRRA